MKPITLRNKKLIATLQSLTDEFFRPEQLKWLQQFVGHQADHQYNNPDWKEEEPYGVSREYLERALKAPIPEWGFPRCSKGIELKRIPVVDNYKKSHKILTDIGDILGTQVNALAMYYPEDGYIGWHHNGNAPGYNVLLTYNSTGDGYFESYNQHTKEYTRMPDAHGWCVKAGYYGNQRTEADKVFWHAAATKAPRMTIAWVLNHKGMWNDMIEEIESE